MTTSQEITRPRRAKRRLRIVGVISVLIMGVAIGYYAWTTRPLIDRQTLREVDFPVYAPSRTLSGYRLDSNQTQVTDDVLTYAMKDQSGGNEITISVQAKPSGFDMSKLTKGGSISSTAVKSGTVYNLSAGGVSKYLLDSGDALIFLTSSQHISTETIHALADSFTRAN